MANDDAATHDIGAWLSTLSAAGCGVLALDRRARVVDINEAAMQLLGLHGESVDAFLARAVADAVDSSGAPLTPDAWPLDAAMRSRSRSPVEGVVGIRADGAGRRWLQVSAVRVPRRTGRSAADRAEGERDITIVGTLMDVTAHIHAVEEALHLAMHDGLTGLPNRRMLMESLDRALRADEANAVFAVLLLDLNGFKEVNDTLGHPAGDELLQHIGKRLHMAVGSDGLAARLGGDEFAVLLNQCDVHPAVATARNIIGALSMPIVVDGSSVTVGTSIGIAVVRTDGTSVEAPSSILHRADVALYAAKAHGGGGRYIVHAAEAEEVSVAGGPSLAAVLREAVDPRQEDTALAVHYQPVLESDPDRVVWYAALARLKHPTEGLLLPARFVPLADEIALEHALAMRVLAEALVTCAAWPRDEDRDLYTGVDVTLAPSVLDMRALPSIVARLLDTFDLSPRRLRLRVGVELTDDVDWRDMRQIKTLREIARSGVRIAAVVSRLDAGRSTAYACRRWPIDRLVLGLPVTRALLAGGTDAARIADMVMAAHDVGLSVAAVGAAAADDVQGLWAVGVDAIQGYAIGVPAPAEAWTSRGYDPVKRL